jgi:hypothetical protein
VSMGQDRAQLDSWLQVSPDWDQSGQGYYCHLRYRVLFQDHWLLEESISLRLYGWSSIFSHGGHPQLLIMYPKEVVTIWPFIFIFAGSKEHLDCFFFFSGRVYLIRSDPHYDLIQPWQCICSYSQCTPTL